MTDAQPHARTQYDFWKRRPETYREPTQEEWVATYDELRAEFAQLRGTLSLAEEGLANYAQEVERLTLHKDVAQKHIDALTAQYGQLRDLLREWLKGCPNPPEWHWSFDLNVRTVNTLNSSREPQTCEHTQQK